MKQLIRAALLARKQSYSPYSEYQVGAALLCGDGTVYTGCNIENAAFGPTICAERVAFFKAISEGKRDFLRIVVAGSPKGDDVSQYAYPCGVCRQVMMEFAAPEQFQVIVAKSEEEYKIMTLAELLPEGFGPGNLQE